MNNMITPPVLLACIDSSGPLRGGSSAGPGAQEGGALQQVRMYESHYHSQPDCDMIVISDIICQIVI